jgi:benzoylformate decarboxylase
MAGTEIVTSDALQETARLAEILGAPVLQQSVQTGAHFLSEHPAFLGALNRDQAQVRRMLEPYDLVICVGAELLQMSVYSEVEPLPPETRVIQIGQRDWEMGKNFPAEMALRADVRETLMALNPLLERLGGAERAKAAKAALAGLADRNWSTQRAKKAEAARQRASAQPIDPDWLMLRLSEGLPQDAIIVDEGLTSARSLLAFWPFRDRHNYFGNVSGGIGWGIAAAVGVQMAQPRRRVAAVIGDGSAMYCVQALWSAAHYKLPVIFVIANNGGYRILKQRLKAFHGNDRPIGMDFRDPPIDVAGLARAYGVPAHRVETGEQFDHALTSALASAGPVLLDVVVQGGT